MPHGGFRPGAGRKSNAEIKNIRSTLDEIIKPKDWRALFTRLLTSANNGSIRAAQLLLMYRFGDPYSIAPQTDEVEPIRFVDYVSRNDDGALPFQRIYHPDGNIYYLPVDPQTHAPLPEPLAPLTEPNLPLPPPGGDGGPDAQPRVDLNQPDQALEEIQDDPPSPPEQPYTRLPKGF